MRGVHIRERKICPSLSLSPSYTYESRTRPFSLILSLSLSSLLFSSPSIFIYFSGKYICVCVCVCVRIKDKRSFGGRVFQREKKPWGSPLGHPPSSTPGHSTLMYWHPVIELNLSNIIFGTRLREELGQKCFPLSFFLSLFFLTHTHTQPKDGREEREGGNLNKTRNREKRERERDGWTWYKAFLSSSKIFIFLKKGYLVFLTWSKNEERKKKSHGAASSSSFTDAYADMPTHVSKSLRA